MTQLHIREDDLSGGDIRARPAIALYRKYGFVACPAFADYVLDDFSQCLTLQLA